MKVIRMIPELIEMPNQAYEFVTAVLPKMQITAKWAEEAAIATYEQKRWPIETICTNANIPTIDVSRTHPGLNETNYFYYTIEDELLAQLIKSDRAEKNKLQKLANRHYCELIGWRDKAEQFMRLTVWQRLRFLFKGDI